MLTNYWNCCIVNKCVRKNIQQGRLAQLGEHLPYKQEVIGSSPIAPTILYGPVVQLVRMPACHAGGRRFEPDPDRQFLLNSSYAGIAQLLEQLICNQQGGGSSPSASSKVGGVPERLKGADCKSVD